MVYALTKIRTPAFRAGLVERAELERRLGEALLNRHLTLLVAPAGFGKTAALSRQLSLLPHGCVSAWVAADEQDDLPRFVSCLIDTLEAYDPPWRVAPESLAEQACMPGALGLAVGEIANTLGAMTVDHGVIVFDDMHTIPDPRIFEFLRKLLELAPLNWTLAISSRTPPPLPLARMRARRELAEFGQADLRFTPQETRLLLRESGQADSDGMVERALGRTDGWIAGLCLILDAAGRSVEARTRRTGLMCGVLMCGPRVLAELVQAPWGSEVPEEARTEMRHWAALSVQAQGNAKPDAPKSALPDSKVLTPREMEVLERIASGDSNKLIARALDLSPHTVKRHVARILDRLDLASRGAAAAWFRDLGVR
jgi:ATP/maltotriose-dependent transcriptional regulator MalT